jgi:radical SAM superfamily enzyme YgiQ (UPF0313 family)
MRVLLISANSERINMTALPLGLGLVAAATRRAGHDVAFLDLLAAPEPLEAVDRAIAAHGPAVIGVSVRNVDDQCREGPRFYLDQARAVVERCRASSPAPVVVGGAGYSIFPTEALRFLGADFGVAGDGEVAFPALLRRISRGEAPADLAGVYAPGREPAVGRSLPDDLDALPVWDQTLASAPADPELWVPIQSRRGCPNDCAYCSTARIQGRRIRFRSPRLVADAIRGVASVGFRSFFFVDNTFNIPQAYALELCQELAALRPRVRWRCIVYPHRLSEELAAAMAAAGCAQVSLGFESGCERILRAMNKRFTPDDVRRTAELLAAQGIGVLGFLLLGMPGETPDSVEQSLEFARSLPLQDLRITVGIRIYPGTALARTAVAEGVIASEAELLRPRFYLAPGLEPWIRQRVPAGA